MHCVTLVSPSFCIILHSPLVVTYLNTTLLVLRLRDAEQERQAMNSLAMLSSSIISIATKLFDNSPSSIR